MINRFYLVGLVLFCGLLGATAQILFKSASRELTLSLLGLLNWKLLTGMVLYFIAMVLFIYALRQDNVSRLYPLIASSYIWAAILANRILHEPLPPFTIIGITLVVIGIGFLTVK